MNKKILYIVAIVIGLGGTFTGGYFIGEGRELITEIPYYIDREVEVPVYIEGEVDVTFNEVMDKLLEQHDSNPTKELLWEGAIDGMIEILDDPYTSYFDYDEYVQYNQNFGETYVGIGVSVTVTDGKIIVETVKNNGPAAVSGMQANDIIVSVDGEDITEESLYEVINKIKGDIDTDVTVGVLRQGAPEIIEITMTRAEIDNPSVEASVLIQEGELIGYIKVNTFGDDTDELFGNAIDDLEAQNITGLIVDLRNNGGGRLSTVSAMLKEFLLDDGKQIFGFDAYFNGQQQQVSYYGTRSSLRDYDVVTIVNGGSASASEVFASAMQEHGGYTVLGTQTFGKGTMQQTPALITTENDALHITIGKWLTSDGNWVHGVGVTPDILVERSAVQRAYKVFLDQEEVIVEDTVDFRTENIQVILNAMGYTVRTDGYFDGATKTAIETIQSLNGITISGEINNETLVVINEFLSTYNQQTDNDAQIHAALEHLVND